MTKIGIQSRFELGFFVPWAMSWMHLIGSRSGLRRLWIGEVVSQAGDSLFQIALIWMVLELTGSSSLTGLVAMSGYLPVLLFGLVAGALADRFDRRRLMLASDLARALLVLVIPLISFMGQLSPLLLGLITFFMAIFTAHFNPARDAIIPQLVETRELRAANTLIQSGWQFALLAGPALAALLIPLTGELHLFTVDGMSFLLSAWFIWRLKPLAQTAEVNVRAQKLTEEFRHALRLAAEGLAYVVADKRLLALFWITAVDNLFIMGPAIVGTPLFVKEILGGDSSQYAWLITAYAVGMLTGSLLLNRLAGSIQDSRILLWGIVLDGITFLPLLWVKSFSAAWITLFVHSLVIPMIVIPRPTLVHHIVPEAMRGRVFSMIGVAVTGLTALSVALTGLIAEWIPINVIFAAIAILGATCGLAGFLIREFREA